MISSVVVANCKQQSLKLQTLEGIEQAIWEQTQQTVLPPTGVFLLQQRLRQRMATGEHSRAFWAN
jgi:hypothetical protein